MKNGDVVQKPQPQAVKNGRLVTLPHVKKNKDPILAQMEMKSPGKNTIEAENHNFGKRKVSNFSSLGAPTQQLNSHDMSSPNLEQDASGPNIHSGEIINLQLNSLNLDGI